jgi:hypothetical protein
MGNTRLRSRSTGNAAEPQAARIWAQYVQRTTNAVVEPASTACVATMRVRATAQRARQPRKGLARMAFVKTSASTSIPKTNAPMALATAAENARRKMARSARKTPIALRSFVSTGFVAMVPAPDLAKRVPRRSKEVAWTVNADQRRVEWIPKAIAVLVRVQESEAASKPAMGRHARTGMNALPAFAPMAFVVTARARAVASLARQQSRKPQHPTAFADRSPQTTTHKTNAPSVIVMALERAFSSLVKRVRTTSNASRPSAPTAFAVIRHARVNVMPAPPRKKVPEAMAHAGSSERVWIPMANALPSPAVVWARVICPSATRAAKPRIATRVIVAISFAAIRPAPAHAKLVRQYKKVPEWMAPADPLHQEPIQSTNASEAPALLLESARPFLA